MNKIEMLIKDTFVKGLNPDVRNEIIKINDLFAKKNYEVLTVLNRNNYIIKDSNTNEIFKTKIEWYEMFKGYTFSLNGTPWGTL